MGWSGAIPLGMSSILGMSFGLSGRLSPCPKPGITAGSDFAGAGDGAGGGGDAGAGVAAGGGAGEDGAGAAGSAAKPLRAFGKSPSSAPDNNHARIADGQWRKVAVSSRVHGERNVCGACGQISPAIRMRCAKFHAPTRLLNIISGSSCPAEPAL